MASRKVLLQVIILGESGVGKTALLHKYVMGKFIEEHKATVGADFLTKALTIEDKMITSQIWDMASQERVQSLGNAIYRVADVCVLVYDITSAASFQKLEKLKSNFLEQLGTGDREEFPFLLLGNKHDLTASREVRESEAKQYAQDNNMLFRETSAVNGHNIEAALREISDIASELKWTRSVGLALACSLYARDPDVRIFTERSESDFQATLFDNPSHISGYFQTLDFGAAETEMAINVNHLHLKMVAVVLNNSEIKRYVDWNPLGIEMKVCGTTYTAHCYAVDGLRIILLTDPFCAVFFPNIGKWRIQ